MRVRLNKFFSLERRIREGLEKNREEMAQLTPSSSSEGVISTKTLDKLSLYDLALYTVDPSWKPLFRSLRDELDQIDTVLHRIQCQSINLPATSQCWLFTPKREDLFRVFRETVMQEVKVVIMGMDPYPSFYSNGDPVAMGIAFSARSVIPPSLANIFKELSREYPHFTPPSTGDLTEWCRQGILLLNASLTHLPNSKKTQKEVWLPLVAKVLNEVSSQGKKLVLCFWGRDAEGYAKYFRGNHYTLYSSHPSPLSATKGDKPFIGNNHFLLINQYLESLGEDPIIWSLV